MGFFSFRKRYDNLGVGPRDFALLPFQTLPPGGSYLGAQWNIRRSLKPLSAPGLMLLNGAVVPTPLTGNGLGDLPGQYALTPLASNNGGKQ